MSVNRPKPTPQMVRIKKKKKPKTKEANAPFWIQLNNPTKRPKRSRSK